jgi:uncharacterized membrane protein YhaH (DUF805 family)
MNILKGVSPRWHLLAAVCFGIVIRLSTGHPVASGTEMWSRTTGAADSSLASAGLLALDLAYMAMIIVVAVRRLTHLQWSHAWALVLIVAVPLDLAATSANSATWGVLIGALGIVPFVLLVCLLLLPGRPMVEIQGNP